MEIGVIGVFTALARFISSTDLDEDARPLSLP
jgi:hypothetical protein